MMRKCGLKWQAQEEGKEKKSDHIREDAELSKSQFGGCGEASADA